MLSAPSAREAPAYVLSDTLVHAEAIGLCAVTRETGILQGMIVGIDSTNAERPAEYRIQRLGNAAAEYLQTPKTLYVVRCEQYTKSPP